MFDSPRLRRGLDQLLHTHDTPERTAAAYALGVFLGFSPLLGLHTILGLAAAFVLRYNRLAVLLGLYSNLPWIMPAYYSLATLGGAALLRADVPPGLLQEFTETLTSASWGEFQQLLRTLTPLVWSFAVGSTVGAIVLAAVGYRVSLSMIVAHRRRLLARSQHPDSA